MTRNEFTEQTWQRLSDSVRNKASRDIVDQLWWVNWQSDTAWRLTDLGVRVLSGPVGMESWKFKFKEKPKPGHLLRLVRYVHSPYAIQDGTLIVFDSGAALALSLHRDPEHWISKLHL